jgi:GT2 family glycosyltransferase
MSQSTVPTVSIVITAFNRNPQLARTLASIRRQDFTGEVIVVDDGDLSHGHPSAALLCESYGARHIPCRRPASPAFRNPALPINIGIRAASGEIVILQNAECEHVTLDTITRLADLVASFPPSAPAAVFAHVVALNLDGSTMQTYCGPDTRRPYFFCGAIRRDLLVRLRGFDEDFTGAGYDDDDLASRLAREGVDFLYPDLLLVHHQWHEPAGSLLDAPAMHALYLGKLAAMDRGELGTARNPQGWGGQV